MLDGPLPIDVSFHDEQLAVINVANGTPWYAAMLITLLINIYHLAL